MGDVVGGVAVVDPIGNGHRAIGRDGEDEEQLAQVRTEVLVVAEGRFHDRLAAAFLTAPGVVGAGHRDRRRIVVELGQIYVEPPDHL